MGIVSLPSYKCYWSQQLRYSPVADVTNDKLAKIRPIVDIVHNQCIEVEPEKYHSVDEQIIPSKTKFSSILQYNPKKPKNGALRAWFVLVKWVDNNVVKLVSNFVGIEPVTSIERWCKKEKNKKDIPVHK